MQNTDASLKQAKTVIKKSHYLIFGIVLVVIIGLAFMSVIGTLSMPSDNTYEQQLSTKRVSDDFYKDPTIERINKLKFSDQSITLTLPSDQRINPFIECYDRDHNLLTTNFAICYDKDGDLKYAL